MKEPTRSKLAIKRSGESEEYRGWLQWLCSAYRRHNVLGCLRGDYKGGNDSIDPIMEMEKKLSQGQLASITNLK